MYIFKNLSFCIILLKLVVSSGEKSEDRSVGGFGESGTVNRGVRESDRGKSNHPTESTIKSSSDYASDSEEGRGRYQNLKNGNTPVPPVSDDGHRNSGSHSDSDRHSGSEAKENENKQPSANNHNYSVEQAIMPDKNQHSKSGERRQENRTKKVQPKNAEKPDDDGTSSDAHANSEDGQHDLDANVHNNHKNSLPQDNHQTDSNSDAASSTHPSVSQSNRTQTGKVEAELKSQRNEKKLREVNGTDNQHSSSAAAAPTNFQESGTRQVSTTETGKKDDAEPAFNNESIIPQTTSAPSKTTTSPTPAVERNPSTQSKSTHGVPVAPVSTQPTPTATETGNLDTESPHTNSKSPTQYTTTIFQTENVTNEFENSTEKDEFIGVNHDDGRIVVTDRTLVDRPILEDADSTSTEKETENSSLKSQSNQAENAPTTDYYKNHLKSSNILTPVGVGTASSTTPSEGIIIHSNETSKNSSIEKNENHVPPEDSKNATTHLTENANSNNDTAWKNETGMPPTNSTENNNTGGPIETIKEFFADLKKHTVLCVISIMLFLLAVSVLVSSVIIIYYLVKYCVLGVVSLCQGGCRKRKGRESLMSIPEGSLFPRCDVNVAPYTVENTSTFRRSSNNAVDAERY